MRLYPKPRETKRFLNMLFSRGTRSMEYVDKQRNFRANIKIKKTLAPMRSIHVKFTVF